MTFEAIRLADLAFMLKDVGTPVRSGRYSTNGELDVETEAFLGNEGASVLGKVRTLAVATGTLGTIKVGSQIKVKNEATSGWTTYTVRDRGEEAKGALEVFLLADY